MTQIIEILEYKPEYLEATRKFLTQLTTRPIQLTEEAFRHTLASATAISSSCLDDKAVAGMLTVGIYHSPPVESMDRRCGDRRSLSRKRTQ